LVTGNMMAVKLMFDRPRRMLVGALRMTRNRFRGKHSAFR
jgi:hypothetical protein